MSYIIAYTDGACKGNGQSGDKNGGYGVHIIYPNGDIHNLWGGETNTTNNRMELLGAILAIQKTPPALPLQIWTDSSYVKNGITQWLAGWKQNGWKTASKAPVKNQDLWQQLDSLCQHRQLDWQWLKGHAGNAGNEKADELANLGVTEQGESYLPSDNGDGNSPQIKTAPTAETVETTKEEPKPKMTVQSQLRHNHQNPDYDGDTSRVNPDFWAVLPDPINRGRAERQLIMDTETTGFNDQGGDRIVEVGIIELVGRKFTGQQLHVYLNPDKEMDDEVIKVHGISNEFLTDKPRFADVALYIYEFMKGAEIIAHNASFDMRFLKMEFDKAGFPDFSEQVAVTDSLALARQMYQGQRNTLDALVSRLGVGKKDRTFHGALLDSEILAEVYLAMTSGQIALAMEEESQDNTETQEIGFTDLSIYAKNLLASVSDMDADTAWRSATLSP